MEQDEFKKLFDETKSTDDNSPDEEWDAIMNKWEEYRNDIISEDGLPIEKWFSYTKNDLTGEIVNNETIIKFICSRRTNKDANNLCLRGFNFFGSAIAHDQNVFVLTSKNGKDEIEFYNGFAKDETSYDKVKEYYVHRVCPLLKNAINASDNLDNIYAFFNSDEYKIFKRSKFFEGLFILESLRATSEVKNSLAWITAPNNIKAIEDLLFTEDERKLANVEKMCFMERNHRVYDRALKWSEVNQDDKSSLMWLNKLLWTISNVDGLFTDFLNPNLIFSGAPATGKTYTVETQIKMLHKIDSDSFPNNPSPKFTQFHPSYTYQDFIEGIKPSGFDSIGNLKLEIMNGSFKQFCIDVKNNNEKMWDEITESGNNPPNKDDPNSLAIWPHYYYVVDEINRGNLANIFGETFTLLEYRDYDFSKNYKESNNSLVETALSNVIRNLDKKDKERLAYKEIADNSVLFGIPFNIHFVGMMNDVDRSIDAFDLAFRRRFKWNPTYCDYKVIKEKCGLKAEDIDKYVKSCRLLNYQITGDERDKPDSTKKYDSQNLGITFQIGHGYFLKIKNISPTQGLKKKKEVLFDNYLMGTLREYLVQNIGEGKAAEEFLKQIKENFTKDDV